MKYFDLTNDELLVAYKAAMGAAMAPLKECAELWCEMERRGIDLVSLAHPFTQFYPRIAAGTLMPETVLKFGGSVKMIELVAKLVPEDQAKISVPGARVEILTPTGVQVRRPEELRIKELKQVFGNGRIRNAVEQKPFVATPVVKRVQVLPEVWVSPTPRTPAVPDTAIAGAFVAAGHETADEKLLRFAIEAWAKCPNHAANGGRRQYMADKLSGELTWALMSQWSKTALVAAIGNILSHAEGVIEAGKRNKPSASTAHHEST